MENKFAKFEYFTLTYCQSFEKRTNCNDKKLHKSFTCADSFSNKELAKDVREQIKIL